MRVERFSILSVTIAAFVMLGVVTVAQTLYSTSLYRDAAIVSKARTIAQMIGVAARKELDELGERAAGFGTNFEQHSKLRQAFRHWQMYQDPLDLIDVLDQPFIHGNAMASSLALEKLRVYTPDGHLIASSSLGSDQLPPGMDGELAMLTISRDGPERLQTLGGLWRTPAKPYYSTIVPLGGLRMNGYLEVVVDPAYNLLPIDEILHLPVRIETAHDGEFPAESTHSRQRRVSYLLTTMDRAPAFFLFGYIPQEDFDYDIRTTSVYLSVLHLAGAGVALLIGYLLLLRLMILPLRKMSRDLRYAQEESVEVSVDARGLREFAELADAFNRLMSEVRAQKDTLRQLSLVDRLTNLANRRAFDLTLEREWQRAIRESQPIALLLLDIDYFKPYNDIYGHQQGDTCLQQVAAVISSAATRSSDLAARYGGEEFAVILPFTDRAGAMIVAEKLTQRVRNLGIPHAGSGITHHVTVSIGVSVCIPSHLLDESCIVRCADHALYNAKHQGRDRVVGAAYGGGTATSPSAVVIPLDRVRKNAKP